MTAVWFTLRIAIFLAIVVPTLIWITRRVREVQGLPSDREVDRSGRSFDHSFDRGLGNGSGV